VAEFRIARITEGIAVLYLMFGRPPSPLAATLAAIVTVGLTAAPGLADQVRDREWWLTEVHVTRAWQVSRGGGVTVAVLDTGVTPSQSDLSRSVIAGPDYTHSGRHSGGTYWGIHGTAMAVLIAGHGHGRGHRDGIIGVAPRAKILSVRVSLEGSDPLRADPAIASRLPDAIAAGIGYAARHGAQVIDLPLDPGAAGVDGTPPAAAAAGGATAERKAVAYALAKGAVLVAPAGDDGPEHGQVNYPAAYPGVISVGAFNKGFAKAWFSSRRSYVTLTAPGEGVITAGSATGYAAMNSTSAASAEVAGMAALIRARYPGLTPPQVGQALTEGSRFGRKTGLKNGSGYGTADAQEALNAAAKIETASMPASPPPTTAPRARAPRRRATVLAYPVISAGGLLLLLLLTVAGWVNRRKRARSKAAGGPRRARATGAQIGEPGGGTGAQGTGAQGTGAQGTGTEPSPDITIPVNTPTAGSGPYDDARPWSTAHQRQRPQLGPIRKPEVGRQTRRAAGPPWEPAPEPDSEPPWLAPDFAAHGTGASQRLPHPADGLDGRNDVTWRVASSRADTSDTADREQMTGRSHLRSHLPGNVPDHTWYPGAKPENVPGASSWQPPDSAAGRQGQAAVPGYPDTAAPGYLSAAAPRHSDSATPGADTQAFPVIPPPGRGGCPDDDEDDRHL